MIFLLDIIFHFFASYIEPSQGNEITHPKYIAINYLTSDFLLDFVSTFPFKFVIVHVLGLNFAGLGSLADTTRILKVLRLKKILTAIKDSNLSMQRKSKLTMIFYLCCIVFYTHIIACLLWWNLKTDNIWIPPVEAGTFNQRVYVADAVSQLSDSEPDDKLFELFLF